MASTSSCSTSPALATPGIPRAGASSATSCPNPLWLLGWAALAGAFVFQAIALHNGPISVVQPLLVTELVFVLVLRWLWFHQSIRRVTWWAAGLTCVSLAVFLTMAEPTGGSALPTSGAWASASTATAATAALLALLALGGSPGRRAALLGASASVLWALVATFIKATTDTLTQFGPLGMFTHWPLYALAVTALSAEFLMQAAFHVGPLSMSQPFIVIVDPIVSIALSVWIFGETFTPDVAPARHRIVRLRRHVRRRRRLGPECSGHHGPGPGPTRTRTRRRPSRRRSARSSGGVLLLSRHEASRGIGSGARPGHRRGSSGET